MRFKIWLLAGLNLVFTWGTVIAATIYYYYEPTTNTSWLSVFGYVVLSVVVILFGKKILHAVRNMEICVSKSVIQFVTSGLFLYILYQIIVSIRDNFDKLQWVILSAVVGLILGFTFKVWAISLDKTYAKKVWIL